MPAVEMSREEAQMLIEILEAEFTDLREEVRHTDSHDYRENLKEREERLGGLLERLRKIAS